MNLKSLPMMGGFNLVLLGVNWLMLGNVSCKLQGVGGVLLKIPSIWTTYEIFDSFSMAYEATCACETVYGCSFWAYVSNVCVCVCLVLLFAGVSVLHL